ncbi:Cro/Cl family transcriptional regulator [Enterococcus ureilyticus]|uniref:Regulatory protein MsrR n=1 Tax=Enterococcus ureilyticus TaxID=1131292 RepID=A0A1E5H8C5_9ENTE|nr:LCP family protein [Enterococcus ureilyticus]MBM7688661.1 LCP family protein required for cell wall assembly [Enterococcus ureilyticus]MBO0447107.1 LCP family protein [Enterococcus ureilyticus]OEG21207.1 Cro/Cl family transcriptional regulator [Enterococcus ureilyticus]
MSRVDRYKHIHDKAKPVEEKNKFNPRKEKNYTEEPRNSHYNEQETLNEPNQQFEQNNNPNGHPNPLSKKGKKPKKIRKKRRFSWPKRILLFFVLLLVLAVGFFFKGKSYAENDNSLPKEALETFNGVKSENGANNILILGSDTRGEDSGRADTIMVLQLDGPSKKPKLISFMRDTFVDIPGYDANKINASYALGGADLVRQTLAENFNIQCRYYAKVDFQSFEKIIDSMFPSGVKMDAEKELNLDGVDIFKGEQKMDGHTLLQYARFRKDEEGDFGRVRRQQQVMTAVMSQLKNPLALLRTPESLGRLVGYMSTDVPTSFMLKNGPSLILKGGSGIERLTIPVENSWSNVDYDYAGSVLEIDLATNQTAVQNFLGQ